jgi:hypothetical protein
MGKIKALTERKPTHSSTQFRRILVLLYCSGHPLEFSDLGELVEYIITANHSFIQYLLLIHFTWRRIIRNEAIK